MAKLIVQLSPDTTGATDGMQTLLKQPGVYAYAVYFDANGAQWKQFFNQTTKALDTSISIDLDGFAAQKVYFILQNTTIGEGSTTLPTEYPSAATAQALIEKAITSESDISQGSAIANNYRFDSFELTMTGGSPSGNLTDVTGYGLPMGVIVRNAHITTRNPLGDIISSAGYGISGNILVNGGTDPTGKTVQGIGWLPNTISNFSSGALAGSLNAVSNSASNPPASAYTNSNWSQYITAIAGSGGADNIIATVSGVFNPGKGSDAFNIAHHYGFYNYEMTYDPDGYGENTSERGVFVLTPTHVSAVKGTVVISKAQLAGSIYGAQGYAQV